MIMALMSGCVAPLSEGRAKSLGATLDRSQTINSYCLVGRGFRAPGPHGGGIIDSADFTPQVAIRFLTMVPELRTSHNLDCHQVYPNRLIGFILPWVDQLDISDLRREFGQGLVLAFETKRWDLGRLFFRATIILGIRATLLQLEDNRTVWSAECKAEEDIYYSFLRYYDVPNFETRTVIGNRLAVECATQLSNQFQEASRTAK